LLDFKNDRTLAPDYAGDVLLWDIDKTYLDTHFSSLRGLAAIPFEFAIDKESIPGAVPLIRALRHGPGSTPAIVPLYFISGSPKELRAVIERRMVNDGVDFDGVTFKDQLGLLLRGRPRGLTEQVGYKLTALLLYQRAMPPGARWLLFGDDVEADAQVFLLFDEVCAGLRGAALCQRLVRLGVDARDIDHIDALQHDLATVENAVTRVFVHLARQSDPQRFTDPRLVPTRSYVQTALVLFTLGRIQPEAVSAVAHAVRRRGMPEATLQAHLSDAATRLGVPPEALALARR
jgi:hypothetical protein